MRVLSQPEQKIAHPLGYDRRTGHSTGKGVWARPTVVVGRVSKKKKQRGESVPSPRPQKETEGKCRKGGGGISQT